MSLTENGNIAVRVEIPPGHPISTPSSGVAFLTDVRPYVLIVSTESAVSAYLKVALGKADPKAKDPISTKNAKWWRKTDLEFIRFAFNETEHGLRFNSYSNNGPYKKKIFQNVSPHPHLFSFPLNAQAEILKAVEALRVKLGVPEVETVDEDFLKRSTLFDYLVKLAYPATQIQEIGYLKMPKEFAASSAWRQALRERTVEGWLQSLMGKRKVTPRMVEAVMAKNVKPSQIIQAWAVAQRDPAYLVERVFLGEDDRLGSLLMSGSKGSQVLARISSDQFLTEMSQKMGSHSYITDIVSSNLSLYKKVPKQSIDSYEQLSEVLDKVKQEYAYPESLEESFQDTTLLLEERGYEVEIDWDKSKGNNFGELMFSPKGKAWTASILAKSIQSHNRVDTVAQTYNINVNWGKEERDDFLGRRFKRSAYVKDAVYKRYLDSLPLVKRQALGDNHDKLLLPPRHAALAFLLTVDDVREQLARVRTNVSQDMLHRSYVYAAFQNYPKSVRVYRRLARMVSLGFSTETIFKLQQYKVPASEFLAAVDLPDELMKQLYRLSDEENDLIVF